MENLKNKLKQNQIRDFIFSPNTAKRLVTHGYHDHQIKIRKSFSIKLVKEEKITIFNLSKKKKKNTKEN